MAGLLANKFWARNALLRGGLKVSSGLEESGCFEDSSLF
jgi:hypothetical protein